jgi:hypothetical protein
VRGQARPVGLNDRVAAVRGHGIDPDAALIAQNHHPTQDQPVERHLIPSDKLQLFAVPRIAVLIGTWQRPGTIAQLCRGRP